jgi:hypothetical protein
MATTAHQITGGFRLTGDREHEGRALSFAAPFLSFCVLAAALIIKWPIQLSIATVFLFAGPHNWIEFRFFLERMPLRWGRARLFYSVALGGVALLAAAYIALYAAGGTWYLSDAAWTVSTAVWNSAVILWISSLIYIRAAEQKKADPRNPSTNQALVLAIGFLLCGAVWLVPFWFSLALVYLHPLVALWFLDRELKRRRPHWRTAYHRCLGVLAALIILIWARLASAPDLPDADSLSWRITQHAGAAFLTGVSSHLLVATHVFLETVHYCAWLALIPMVGLGAPLWKTARIPLASRGAGWPRSVRLALVAAAFVVLVLWVSFGVSFATTRDIYFTFAMAHVLAEAPFLIRLVMSAGEQASRAAPHT